MPYFHGYKKPCSACSQEVDFLWKERIERLGKEEQKWRGGEETGCCFEGKEEAVKKKSGRENGIEGGERAFDFSHFA